MKKYSPVLKVSLLFVVILVAFALVWNQEKQKNEQEISALKAEILLQESNKKELNQEIEKITNQYDNLYKEKHGLANEKLLKASEKLFSNVVVYDTEKKEDSISERKKRTQSLAEPAAVEALFPKDADKGVATVSTVSAFDNPPEVYLLSSDDKEVKALVWIDYSVSFAEGESQKGTILYKVQFNQMTEKFESVQNLGTVNTP